MSLSLSCSCVLFSCVCVCECEALDAPSPRLCVCSHGQQGVNPPLSLLSHSWSLGGIIALHLSLPGFFLIGPAPNLPEKQLYKSATYPHQKLIFRQQSWDSHWYSTQRFSSPGLHWPDPKTTSCCCKAGLSPHVTPSSPHFCSISSPFAARFINMFEVDVAGPQRSIWINALASQSALYHVNMISIDGTLFQNGIPLWFYILTF